MKARLPNWLLGLFGRAAKRDDGAAARGRGPATHVVLLDGTLSTLRDGSETNVGLIYKLLREMAPSANQTVFYEAGIQWQDWRGAWDVMTGRGINLQIKRAYGALASRYRDGDKIVLIGYSRGAYAVRSLAGVIDRVGLLKSEHAAVRHIRTAYRHYEMGGASAVTGVFRKKFCHDAVEIEAVAVFDTVKALGIRLPVLWQITQGKHAFHDHALGPAIRNGFHALSLDERRVAYAPVMWFSPQDWEGHMEQVWFRGTHGDVGGQINGRPESRPLASIPLVWMIERLLACGLQLPDGAVARFDRDVNAPSAGRWHGWSKFFLNRRRRTVGQSSNERLHKSVPRADYDWAVKALGDTL